MTEDPYQGARGKDIAQADRGGTATVIHLHNPSPNDLATVLSQRPAPPPVVHLPSAPPLFIGRQAELAALTQRLQQLGAVVSIPGIGGRGKTTLALHYAHLHRHDFESVHWLPCQSRSLGTIAAELAWQLSLKLDGDLDAIVRELNAHCARKRCLLILDDVDDEAPARLLVGGLTSVLITTRFTNLRFLRQHKPLDLPLFTEEQCFELFREVVGAAEVDRHQAEARALFDRLGRLPFAIAVAAGLIREDVRYTIAGMARRLPADVTALLAEAIAALTPAAQALLAAMGACAPEGLRLSLAAQVAAMDEETSLVALNELRTRSLAEELDRDTHRYRIHPLVREAAGATDAQRARQALAVYEQFQGWEANWRECEQDLADWRTAFAWSLAQQESEDAWSLAKSLASNGYRLTYRLGRLSEAYEVGQQVDRESNRRDDRWCLQASYGNQALILLDWGRLDDAMALHKKEEALCDELGDKAGLSTSYGNQAVILQDWGRLDEAMALHQKEEALCDELGDKAGLSRSYGNQALILRDWGRLDEAMSLQRRKEALCEGLGDKAGLSLSYGNQGVILQAWGQLDDAMALLQRQETLCDELGDKAGLARCYGNQGLLARQRGDVATEREKLQRCLALFTELRMPRERDHVQRLLDRANGLDSPESS